MAAARARLHELHAVAVEELQAARLAAGNTAEAVAILTGAVTEAPYRERRWELLVLGLYRSGRQGHALAELRRIRTMLADDLGVDPGPGLQELERQLLDHDPALLPVAATRSVPLSSTAVPALQRRLSRPLSLCIGRESELALLSSLLEQRRLVTLVGPGGVGKTRLAIEHRATLPADGEVWTVRLADVREPDAIAAALADAIGVEVHLGDPVRVIGLAVGTRQGLLVLDNCEHQTDPVGELVVELLARCPSMRILATSREPLGVDGECLLPVDPLPVRGEGSTDGAGVLLLIDRISAARPGWQPTEADLESARQICEALDGLPLAIELAAAQERGIGLAGLANHLQDRFALLGAPAKGSLTPHATLRAAIDWSVQLLPDPDRAMLLRLWPFDGGFSWQAADAVQPVVGAGRPVLATLVALVNRSVVVVEADGDRVRYRLLETVRARCRELDPDPAATSSAHASWLRGFVLERTPQLAGADTGRLFRELVQELPNIRAGIDHDLVHDPVHALATAAGLDWLWSFGGSEQAGVRLIRAALDAVPPACTRERSRGLLALSIMAFHAGRPEQTLRLADEALELVGAPADDAGRQLHLRGLLYRSAGTLQFTDADTARRAADQAIQLAERYGADEWIKTTALLGLGASQVMQGQVHTGEQTLIEARERSARCGHHWGRATAELMLAWTQLREDDTDTQQSYRVLGLLRDALAVFTDQRNGTDQLGVLYAAAHALPSIGRRRAAILLRAAVREHSDRIGADPTRYVHIAGPAAARRLDRLLPAEDMRDLDRQGRDVSWLEMVELFSASLPRD